MRFRRIAAIAIFSAFGASPSAQAFDLSVLGAVAVSNYNFSPTPAVSPSTGVNFGGGALAGFELNPFFAFETGALYLTHSYSQTFLGFTTTYGYNYLEIPAMVRFSPIGFVAVNLGAYYGIRTGGSVSI